jgi:hypothetical protein
MSKSRTQSEERKKTKSPNFFDSVKEVTETVRDVLKQKPTYTQDNMSSEEKVSEPLRGAEAIHVDPPDKLPTTPTQISLEDEVKLNEKFQMITQTNRPILKGNLMVDLPTTTRVFIKNNKFYIDSGLESYGEHVHYEVKSFQDCIWMDQGTGWQSMKDQNQSKKIMREIQTLEEKEIQREKEEREFPTKALQFLVDKVMKMEKEMDNLRGDLRTANTVNSKKNPPILKSSFKKGKKEKKKWGKTSSESSTTSSTSSNEEGDSFDEHSSQNGTKRSNPSKERKTGITYTEYCSQGDNEWKSYLSKRDPLYLPNPEWIESWLQESRPPLKVIYKTMRKLQTKQANSLKQLAMNCKDFNQKIAQLSGGSTENFSISNVAKSCRSYMLRFGVSPTLFCTIFVEFCLGPSLKSLALNNAEIMKQGEAELLKWLARRTLNKSSEIRLKLEIKNYLKKSLHSGKNTSKILSDVQGLMVPELLQSSVDGYSADSPAARTLQCQRETRLLLLESLQENHPDAYNYLGTTGELTEDLESLSQKLESFLNFTKVSDKRRLSANVDKKADEQSKDNRTIMEKILDIEKPKYSERVDKVKKEVREKCSFHSQMTNGFEKCQKEKRHCCHHSIKELRPFPCEECPEWLREIYKKK